MNAVVRRQPNSPEEFIAVVKQKISEGNLPAFDSSGCFYRGSSDSKYKACLIGLCLTDKQLEDFEIGNEVVVNWNSEQVSALPSWLSRKQAENLQDLHDMGFAADKLPQEQFLSEICKILNVSNCEETLT